MTTGGKQNGARESDSRFHMARPGAAIRRNSVRLASGRYFILLLLFSLVTTVPAAEQGQENTACDSCNRSALPRYVVKTIQSRVVFTLTSLSMLSISGTAGNTSGYINYDPARPADSNVSISLKTNDIVMGNHLYDRLVKSRPFLNVRRYPEITFISDNVAVTDDGQLLVNGVLTIKGSSHRETLAARLVEYNDDTDLIKFDASTSILRSNYNINVPLFFLSDKIDFQIEIIGERSGP